MLILEILCASRNPTSPSRTSSCTKVAQDGAKLAPNWVQKSTKNGVPHRTWGPKMGYPIGPWDQKFEKNRVKKATQQKRGRSSTESLHFDRKSGQHGPNLAPKLELKWTKNRCKNRSKIWCILGSIFGRILEDFGRQNGAKLAPKSIKNRCQLRSAIFWKIVLSLQRGLDFWDSGGRSWE